MSKLSFRVQLTVEKVILFISWKWWMGMVMVIKYTISYWNSFDWNWFSCFQVSNNLQTIVNDTFYLVLKLSNPSLTALRWDVLWKLVSRDVVRTLDSYLQIFSFWSVASRSTLGQRRAIIFQTGFSILLLQKVHEFLAIFVLFCHRDVVLNLPLIFEAWTKTI